MTASIVPYGVCAIVPITPLILVFLVAQRRFIEGIAFTGMK
jgi:ABC-type glycerol-3-phosphate transport system permease component